MKKALSVLLAVMMIAALALTGCGQNTEPQTNEEPTTRTFTDSLGREVTLPTDLTKIAISGPLAQIVVFAIAPEMMVGIANEWSQEAKDLIPGEYYTLPLLGQLYGGKGELNLETLLQSGAQVVIDVGEQKDGMADDLNALQEQTGIPFVHIDCYTATMGDTYRALGALLGKETEGNALAEYCDGILTRTKEIAGSVEKANRRLPGSATWAIQMRLSEALCVLAFFTPAAVPGLTVGCLLFNITFAAALPLDFVVGSAATLIAAEGMWLTRKVTVKGYPLVGMLMPAIANAFLVGWELTVYIGGGFVLNAVYVAIGEAVVLLVPGTALYYALKKRGLDTKLFA